MGSPNFRTINEPYKNGSNGNVRMAKNANEFEVIMQVYQGGEIFEAWHQIQTTKNRLDNGNYFYIPPILLSKSHV